MFIVEEKNRANNSRLNQEEKNAGVSSLEAKREKEKQYAVQQDKRLYDKRRSNQWNVAVFHYVHRDIIKGEMCRKKEKSMYNFDEFVHFMTRYLLENLHS